MRLYRDHVLILARKWIKREFSTMPVGFADPWHMTTERGYSGDGVMSKAEVEKLLSRAYLAGYRASDNRIVREFGQTGQHRRRRLGYL